MLKLSVVYILLILSLPLCVSACSDYQVTFKTVECNGDTGMATVAISDIYKIQAFKCDPPNSKVKLKQLLVRSGTYGGSYEVFTVDEKSADRIMKEIDSYMKAKKNLLENSNSVILHDVRD